MFRSLHMKLTLILLLLITSLMAVVGAFLTVSVSSFYINAFYQQMSDVFGGENNNFVFDLRGAAADPEDPAGRVAEILEAKAGSLGVDYRTRNYFVLDGETGAYISSSADEAALPRQQSANLLSARNAVLRRDETSVGDESDITADFMDVAVPVMGGENAFIVYILDNKDTVSGLNSQLFLIIMQALVIGLLISVLLSFLLSKTMVGPIEKLTAGAERVAAGDFGSELLVESADEIGILTGTFNEMADILQSTLAAVENERNKLDTLFLHMTDGVVAFSREGEVIHSNPAAARMLRRPLGPEASYEALFGGVADAVTTATPLAIMKSGDMAGLTSTYSIRDMFLGNIPGSMGEISALMVLIGGVYLIARKVINWHTPVSYIATVAVLTFLFPKYGSGVEWMLYSIFGGGLMLGAFFMATDYATSPVTKKGQVIFGIGCGLFTVFIRYFGSYNEGVCYSIMVMNLCVALIDKYTKPTRFGVVKSDKKEG